MFRGHLDRADRELIQGWAYDTDDPDTPIPLSITIDGELVATVLADAYRLDLEDAGIASGRHSFVFRPGQLLPATRATLRVHRNGGGPELLGSPAALEASSLASTRTPFATRTQDVLVGGLDDAIDGALDGAIDGALDIVSRDFVAGWVRTLQAPGTPVSLLVSVNGSQVARVLANSYRADLEHAGFGAGRHAFSVCFQNISPLEPFVLRI